MLILNAKTALNVLDNGVMNTPKRRILSLGFTVVSTI